MDVTQAIEQQKMAQHMKLETALHDADEALIKALMPELMDYATAVYTHAGNQRYQEATDAMALVNRTTGVALQRAFESQSDEAWALVRAVEREAERCQRKWKQAYDALIRRTR